LLGASGWQRRHGTPPCALFRPTRCGNSVQRAGELCTWWMKQDPGDCSGFSITPTNIHAYAYKEERRATGWTARIRFPAVQGFSLLHSVQTDSGAPASCPMCTGAFLPGVKAAGAWSWLLTSTQCRGQERLSYTSTHPYVFMV
jgi:hypothetical protein